MTRGVNDVAQRGSIRKRGATWTAYYFVAGPDGSRVQKSKGGFRTKREAQAFLTDTLSDVQKGMWAEPTKVTVKAFLVDHWLPTVDQRTTTRASYRMVIDSWIVPELGAIWLAHLTASDVQRMVDNLRAKGGRKGTGLGPRSVQLSFTVLRMALQHAVVLGFIPRNPTVGLKRPSIVKTEQSHWSAAETRAFIEFVSDDRLAAFWTLALLRGFRRSELAGLRWTDVDLDAGRLQVAHTRTIADGVAVESTPKTSAGRRMVKLDSFLVGVLRAHRRRQLEERLAWGPEWVDTGLVFVREDGTPPLPEHFSNVFERLVKNAGLPPIRLHDARHTCATLALQQRIPTEVVSKMLGHASPAITSGIYSHVTPAMLEESGEELTNLVMG